MLLITYFVYVSLCPYPRQFPADIYLLKANMETIETGVFIVNFEHISQLFLVLPLLTLNK